MKGTPACVALLLVIGALALPARANPTDWTLDAERWQRQGYDQPDAALAELDRALIQGAPPPAALRLLQRTRGLVAARAGRDDITHQALAALGELAQAGQSLASADSELVRAEQAEHRGHSQQAQVHARAASEAYERQCGGALHAEPPSAACDHRPVWLARHLLARRASEDGDARAAREQAEGLLALAQRANDIGLVAWSQARLAAAHAAEGQVLPARRLMAQAEASLRNAGEPFVRARVALVAVVVASMLDDQAALERAARGAREHAREAASPRLEALALANLSDVWVRRGRPAEALAAVREALPTVRAHDDRRVERVLLHNGALALIGLGRVAEARAQAERLLELWAAEGTQGEQARALREVADALADAGHAGAALDLYHRERALTDKLAAAQREAAERTLRARYDRDRDRRRIELLARDNAIAQSELGNRELGERLWALATAVLAAAALLVGLMLRRVRATQRSLQSSQARLRVQSERDALTGVANRRSAQQRLAASASCQDALLLVDVDHFKRVNDSLGHAAGDQVLVAVAQRLQAAVRERDLVARWGGEEFLVIAPGAEGAILQALAQRLMQGVSSTPVRLSDGREVAVTVSIGHAAFPLAPRAEPLGWERALNLTDMALYTAKSLGRHRSVGLQALADMPDALARAERDFERAWAEGVVRLAVQPGA